MLPMLVCVLPILCVYSTHISVCLSLPFSRYVYFLFFRHILDATMCNFDISVCDKACVHEKTVFMQNLCNRENEEISR
jgi:hypothetical protein